MAADADHARRSCSACRSWCCRRCPSSAAIAVCAPMRTLWPIWIWLSSFTPSSSTVSSMAPRSIVVFAPISHVRRRSTTRADLRHLDPLAAPRARIRSRRAPITAPGCTTQRAPTCTPRHRVTRATSRMSSPIVTSSSMTQCGPTMARAPDDGAPRRSRTSGPTWAVGSIRAAVGDDGGRMNARRRDVAADAGASAIRAKVACGIGGRRAPRPDSAAAAARVEHDRAPPACSRARAR